MPVCRSCENPLWDGPCKCTHWCKSRVCKVSFLPQHENLLYQTWVANHAALEGCSVVGHESYDYSPERAWSQHRPPHSRYYRLQASLRDSAGTYAQALRYWSGVYSSITAGSPIPENYMDENIRRQLQGLESSLSIRDEEPNT